MVDVAISSSRDVAASNLADCRISHAHSVESSISLSQSYRLINVVKLFMLFAAMVNQGFLNHSLAATELQNATQSKDTCNRVFLIFSVY